jgi:hypothetical protein
MCPESYTIDVFMDKGDQQKFFLLYPETAEKVCIF